MLVGKGDVVMANFYPKLKPGDTFQPIGKGTSAVSSSKRCPVCDTPNYCKHHGFVYVGWINGFREAFRPDPQ